MPNTTTPELAPVRQQLADSPNAPADVAAEREQTLLPQPAENVVELPRSDERKTYEPPAGPPLQLLAKLADVFAELDDVEPDKTHDKQGWEYASSDAVMRTLRAPLRDKRVLVFSSTRHVPAERSAGEKRVVVTIPMTCTFVDADSGETWEFEWYGAGTDADDKVIKKALTNGVTSFLRDQFLLPQAEVDKPATAQQLEQVRAAYAGKFTARTCLDVLLAAREITVETGDLDEAALGAAVHKNLNALTEQETKRALLLFSALPEVKAA